MAKKQYDDAIGAMFGDAEIIETQENGNKENSKQGNKETRKTANKEKGLQGNVEVDLSENNEQIVDASQGKQQTRKQGNKENSKQGNVGDKKREYYYGAKHTFSIPDELWDIVVALLAIQGKKQNELIIELLQKYVDDNSELAKAISKLKK